MTIFAQPPFGLSLSKPFISLQEQEKPFDKLRANGGKVTQ